MSDFSSPGSGNLPAIIPGKPKPFWEQPGGKVGTLLGWALIGLAGWGIVLLLPTIIQILHNLLLTAILGLALAGLTYVVFDKQVHLIVWNLYKMILRRIATAVIEYDPVAIAKNYIDYLKGRRQIIVDQIRNLRGQIESLTQYMADNEKDRVKSLSLMQQAQKAKADGRALDPAQEQAMAQAVILNARRAGRRSSSNMTAQKVKERLELLYRTLNKILSVVDFTIEDLTDDVSTKERERKAILAGSSALRAAMDILQGRSDRRAMFDEAMQFMVDDAAARFGEVDAFLEMSGGFIASIDLENMAYEEDAMKQLEEWEKRIDDKLLAPGDKQLLLEAAQDPDQVLVPQATGSAVDREAIPESIRDTPRGDRYHSLFGDDSSSR